MRTGAMQLGDDVRDRLADPLQLAQPVLRNDLVERLDQGGECVSGALVGFRAEIIVAGQGGAPAELDQQPRDRGCVEPRNVSPAAAARPPGSSSTLSSSR